MSGKLNIDGGQAKEEEHVSSYTPIREAETGIFHISRAYLATIFICNAISNVFEYDFKYFNLENNLADRANLLIHAATSPGSHTNCSLFRLKYMSIVSRYHLTLSV